MIAITQDYPMIAGAGWFTELELRRVQLGMSKAAVAKRSGVSLPTVDRILAGREQSPRVANIQAIAAALGVEVRIGSSITVHVEHTAQDFRRRQAATKAERMVKLVQGNMSLESQAVDSATVKDMIDQTTCELLAGSPRKLWDD
jgi:transcriptional regulator with XRE-family HTH domain